MKNKLCIILFLFISQGFVFSQSISIEEQKLYNIIMEYRRLNGLPSIPLSGSLTFVAQTHVKDLQTSGLVNGTCNLHSWSSNGSWTSCCYTSDHAKASCMWEKPRELTNYKGNGYEISYCSYGMTAKAEGALNSWKGSSGHNAVLINQGIWADNDWAAIGIGISNGYAVVWFGAEVDYASKPTVNTAAVNFQAPNLTSTGTKTTTNVTSTGSSCSSNSANNETIDAQTQKELTELRSQVSQLNRENSDHEKTIAQLNRENSTLKNSTSILQQQKNEKELQYNTLHREHQTLSDRRTTVRKSKYNADEFHALTMKIGLNTFYQSISDLEFQKINASLLSFGAETMIGFNFGESYRRNSIGITLRVNQANRFLTGSIDSSAIQPMQFYDAELTTIIREWFSFGFGANMNSSYGSSTYQVNPSVSLGLCIGPKNWKIQISQQASMNSNMKIYGRASIGLSLRL